MPVSPTLAINERATALRRAGRTVRHLGFGQSPFPIPPSVVRTLGERAGESDYLPVRGLYELRAKVSAYYQRRLGLSRTPQDVMIGPGSKELLFLIQAGLWTELLLPSPSWVSYEPQARLLDGPVRWLETRAEDRWCLRPEVLDAACQGEARPRTLILNSPNNPTGCRYTDARFAELAQVARKHRLLVLADDIYGELAFDGVYRSIATHYPEGTIVTSGLSKWCGAGGWRLGTALFPPELDELGAAVAAMASETFTAVAAPIQYAAVAAFEDDDELTTYLDRVRRILGTIALEATRRLQAAGVGVVEPEGGFYLFADFSCHQERLPALVSSQDFAEYVLEQVGVAMLPGTAFGRPEREWTMRIAFVDFDGEAALTRAAELDAQGLPVDCANLSEVLHGTLDGIARLASLGG